MIFFKFVDGKDMSLSYTSNAIHYVKGKTIEVKDANPDSTVQCGSGIHCILFDGTKPIDDNNILFGPRIAVLEADEKDVIYYSEDGKCRLKKCKVLDVYDIKELPEELKSGRGDVDFADHILTFLQEKLQYDEAWLKVIIQDFNIFSRYVTKLDKYYPKLEDSLCDSGELKFACRYTYMTGKYHRKEIREWVEEPNSPGYLNDKFNWLKKFKIHSENFEKNILKSGDLDDILKYAVTMERDTKEIRYEIKNRINKVYYSYDLERYVTQFINNNVEEIAELLPSTAMAYARKTGKATPLMKEKIKTVHSLAKEYVLTIENDEDFYSSIYNEFDSIIKFFNHYTDSKDQEKFVNKLLENTSYILYMTNVIGLTRIRNLENGDKIDKIFLLTSPSLYDILSYFYNIRNTSKIILDYIKEKFTIDDITLAIYNYGKITYFEQIFDLFSDGKEKYQESLGRTTRYFKVVKVLRNSSKVSAEFTKESGMRVTYQNAGNSVEVQKGMVFDNIFSAQVYAELLRRNLSYKFAIFYCTGENFNQVLLSEKLNKNSKNEPIDDKTYKSCYKYGEDYDIFNSFNVELSGSGYLNKIRLSTRYNYW